MKSPPAQREFLEQRNALWGALRQLEPTNANAEPLLQKLETLIGWSREKILAGLGWTLPNSKSQDNQK